MAQKKHLIKILLIIPTALAVLAFADSKDWSSRFLSINEKGKITYHPDEKGNIIPDFSLVGYHHGNKNIPEVNVVKTISPIDGDAGEIIQKAINEVSQMPLNKSGFRGAILIRKGIYKISGDITIMADGLVIKGEGDNENGTHLIVTGKGQRSLIKVNGKGKITETVNTRTKITDDFVPVGSTSFNVANSKNFKIGDKIILYRPGTDKWISDIQMDKITERKGTIQWKASDYSLSFEREITDIKGSKIEIDNPVVMEMETKYGGGEIYKYSFNGRIKEIGIENILFTSEYANDIDEDHGWTAINFNNIENGWVRNITAKFFGFAAVSLSKGAKNITVKDSKCLDAKSIITGGRRYSFNNDGQQNLFMNLETTEGRHDYVTGAKTLGPNVFYNCKSTRTHADIGPHHRWAVGTLYDNITTDGEINVQDRGNWGSGHGWAGVTQILWNCKVKGAAIQSPWVSGKNYAIGVIGQQLEGRLKDKPKGEWEGLNKGGLNPKSLYMAQLNARLK